MEKGCPVNGYFFLKKYNPDPPSKKRKTSLRLTDQADRMFLGKKTIINEVQPI
jgi:hypothetical protein